MALAELFEELADVTEMQSRIYRSIAAEYAQDRLPLAELPVPTSSALGRALAIHPGLGARQRVLIALVEREGDRGADTGTLSRAMDYDQPNVYLTLQGLIRRDFIRRDTSQHPHRYYLGPALLDPAA